MQLHETPLTLESDFPFLSRSNPTLFDLAGVKLPPTQTLPSFITSQAPYLAVKPD